MLVLKHRITDVFSMVMVMVAVYCTVQMMEMGVGIDNAYPRRLIASIFFRRGCFTAEIKKC